jgi:hypothetical protein
MASGYWAEVLRYLWVIDTLTPVGLRLTPGPMLRLLSPSRAWRGASRVIDALPFGYIKDRALPHHPFSTTQSLLQCYARSSNLLQNLSSSTSLFAYTTTQLPQELQVAHQIHHPPATLELLDTSPSARALYNAQLASLPSFNRSTFTSQCLLNDLLTFLPALGLLPADLFRLCPTEAKSASSNKPTTKPRYHTHSRYLLHFNRGAFPCWEAQIC